MSVRAQPKRCWPDVDAPLLESQAKLIDFLQAKVEEAGRKKCSLSNKLFGRSGRRTAASPPLRRANRELREEVERLRAKLAACNAGGDMGYPSTPKREKPKPIVNGSNNSIDSPDGAQDKGLLIVWSDGGRERMRGRCVEECLVLSSGNRELRGHLLTADAKNLPHNEANRAFMVKLENCERGQSAAVAIAGDSVDGPCAAVACGRRVFLLRYDASTTEFKIARSLTVDRAANSLLLTTKTLYIAGEKPLKVNLPAGALESFGMDEPTVAAAAKKHSPPKAFLLIKNNPTEILICYAECGIFVDENGKRTRNEDPKWSTAVYSWEFVNPFLYVIGDDKVTIVYLNDDAYRTPPCTCDTTSLASTASDCYLPEIFTLKMKEPVLLGTAPRGIIIRYKTENSYNVSMIEGMAAFRSVGASVESLATISDTKGSTTDLAQSMTDVTPQDISQESVEVTTGFLADIRKRARQLRNKHRKEQTPDDVIKEILTTEVDLKRTTNGRKSPATISEFDSDTDSVESDTKTESPKGTADLCAEMFTRQVRFQ
uniref:CNH domain-containing protein n=1 Tax=Heliothis virescens TaxID=7102 RepID=A0A2A4IVA7_HELVI